MKKMVFLTISLFITSLSLAQTDTKFQDYLAAERLKLPAAGVLLFDCSTTNGFTFGGDNGATKKLVNADTTLPFSKAFQLDIKKTGANTWEPQFQTPSNKISVNNNDILLYIYYIRVLESEAENGAGQAIFYVQKSSSPWTGLGSQSITARPLWQKYYVVAKAADTYNPGTMGATFHLGFLKQKVEIGGIIALNLGPDIDVNELPANPLYYEGMEPDALWRTEAENRIELNRKGDLTVSVLNKYGEPIKNASVHVEMLQHEYGFGTFIEDLVLENTPDAEKYKAELLKLFNRATTPFYMGGNKNDWGWYSSSQNQITYMDMAGWLQDNGIITKGHVLIWPGWVWMPSFFEDLKNDPAALRQAIEDHLDELVPIGTGYGLAEWDVVNEPYINHDVMDVLGEDVLVDWYKHVHSLDPEPNLILNEYNILSSGGVQAFQNNLARVIELLQAGGAPIGGIGMQCHFDENLTSIPDIINTLDRFAQYHIPIQVTEFDIDTRDEAGQAAYTRDFYTAIFSHPATEKVVMWGFWEGMMWKPNGALIRTDWSYKPNYDVISDLLFNKWWTDIQGNTNNAGIYKTRGFKGRYKITASVEGQSMSTEVSLSTGGAAVELSIPVTSTGITLSKSPVHYGLLQNYPNPFNGSTVIEFMTRQSGKLNFNVYNITGSLVFTKTLNAFKDITHKVTIDSQNFSSGIYYYCIEQNNIESPPKKMVVLK